MDSKLFSNQPLSLLKDHIEELKGLLLREQKKNKALKSALIKVHEMSRKGNTKDLSSFVFRNFELSGSLSGSLRLSSFDGGILAGIFKVFLNRVRKCFGQVRDWDWGLIRKIRRVIRAGKAVELIERRVKRKVFNRVIYGNRKSNLKALQKILVLVEDKQKKAVRDSFFCLKFNEEIVIFYEQGLELLKAVLFRRFLGLKSSSFLMIKRGLVKNNRAVFKVFIKVLKSAADKKVFSGFTEIKGFKKKKIVKVAGMTLKLNSKHHEVSEKMLNLFNFPLKMNKLLVKSAFLSLVSFVSYQISLDIIEKKILQRLADVLKSLHNKCLVKFYNRWKGISNHYESSLISSVYQIPLLSSQHDFRTAFINLNLTVQRVFTMNKSIALTKWQDFTKHRFRLSLSDLKENIPSSLHKKNKSKFSVLKINNNLCNL